MKEKEVSHKDQRLSNLFVPIDIKKAMASQQRSRALSPVPSTQFFNKRNASRNNRF